MDYPKFIVSNQKKASADPEGGGGGGARGSRPSWKITIYMGFYRN